MITDRAKLVETYIAENLDGLMKLHSKGKSSMSWDHIKDAIIEFNNGEPKEELTNEYIRNKFKIIREKGINASNVVSKKMQKSLKKLKKKGFSLSISDIVKENYQSIALKPFVGGDPENVLVIGDIHLPYCLEGYIDFCRHQQEKYNCGTVIYIGDIVDFHSISYHEKLPEEMNPAGEIAKARLMLQDWYTTFPEAIVLMGNHDNLIRRVAKTAGLLREYIKDPREIFQAPESYLFLDEVIIDNVLYTHGSTSDAFKKCILENHNMVSGHAHTKCGIIYHQNRHGQLFGMQVGVGIDYKAKAFDYAKSNSKYPVTACGVVLESGKQPSVIPFNPNGE